MTAGTRESTSLSRVDRCVQLRSGVPWE